MCGARTLSVASLLLAAIPFPLQARPGESTTVEFPQAYGAALATARADGVDFAETQLHSLTFLRSQYSELSPASRTDATMVDFRKPLAGKEYWLACLGPKEPMLGGVRCYAMERGSLRLLSTYRGK
jgi:hypothetical protein